MNIIYYALFFTYKYNTIYADKTRIMYVFKSFFFYSNSYLVAGRFVHFRPKLDGFPWNTLRRALTCGKGTIDKFCLSLLAAPCIIRHHLSVLPNINNVIKRTITHHPLSGKKHPLNSSWQASHKNKNKSTFQICKVKS